MNDLKADYQNQKNYIQTLVFAKNKAKKLPNKKMIRLFADKNICFYLYRENNITFIGSYVDGTEKEMNNFFSKKDVFYFTDNKTGNKKMKFQIL